MSKFEDGSYGSLTGVALIGKVLAGRCGMKYTRAAVGNGVIPEDETPKTMSGPAGYVMDAKIAAVTNPIDGECQVTVQIKSDDVATGFYATCIVLFAEDPDAGEVPYTYLSLENEPEWIRPASSIVGKLATFDLIAAVGDIDAVSAIIDPEAIATVGRVEQMLSDHNADPNAHGGIGSAVIKEIVIPTAGWVKSEDDCYVDVLMDEARDDLYPAVSLHNDSLAVAKTAGFSPSVLALSGALRFWAAEIPASDLNATVALLYGSGGAGGGGGIGVLPIATRLTLGGVKIGDGVNVSSDGTISTDDAAIINDVTATETDTDEMLDEVFSKK